MCVFCIRVLVSRVIDIVYHPTTLERAHNDPRFKAFIVELAFQRIEATNIVSLHRGIILLCVCVMYMFSILYVERDTEYAIERVC